MRGYEVADQDKNSHDDVFCDGDDVGAGDFDHGDTAIGLIGSVEIDVVGADAGGDSELEFFGLGETFGG